MFFPIVVKLVVHIFSLAGQKDGTLWIIEASTK
jgi:hypothetical protein